MAFSLTMAFTGKNRSEILADVDAAEQERNEKGFQKIKLVYPVRQLKDFERLMAEYKPTITIIDQLTKLEGASTSDKTQDVLDTLALKARNLATIHDTALIGVHQGKGDVENKKWLELGDLYNCRVAIQKELDYAIGIGRLTDDATKKYQRFFNISKNKIYEGETGRFVCHFDNARCLWKE